MGGQSIDIGYGDFREFVYPLCCSKEMIGIRLVIHPQV
jgi:hypothetical protein